MIDLKNEIEKLQVKLCELILEQDEIYLEGMSIAYENCIALCDQYNIITAPKTIKLSEIVDRLTNELKDYVVRYVNNSGITICQDGWYYAIVYIDEDTHNFEFDFHDRFNFPKWLYTLWIAGTIIEDDLKEE